MAKKLGLIASRTSALWLCDIQEGFRKTISYYPQMIEVSQRMVAAARLLDMSVVVTEQFPKGLGPTVSELDISGFPVFPKKSFCGLLPEVQAELDKTKDLKSVIMCGIESHVCIQSTVLDLLDKDYDVHVIVDAVSSRSMTDRMFSLQRMSQAGAFLTTSESMILNLCKGADHPQFKPLQKIIWDAAPDTGLLSHSIKGENPV